MTIERRNQLRWAAESIENYLYEHMRDPSVRAHKVQHAALSAFALELRQEMTDDPVSDADIAAAEAHLKETNGEVTNEEIAALVSLYSGEPNPLEVVAEAESDTEKEDGEKPVARTYTPSKKKSH